MPADGPVPNLRFPEFRDAGPWEVKRLGELVTTITPPKKLQTTEYQPSGQFPIIDQSPNDICGWTDDEAALVEVDFPVVVFGDHSCVVKLVESPFAQGADGIKILAPADDIDGRFLFLSLEANPVEQKGYNRHFSDLKEKLIPLPLKSSGEQQKIADCLSSLDDLIRAEEGRLGALKDHKRGLMQRLFPRPGQTTPRLRFPEFRDAGPWEVKRLGDVYRFKPTNSFPRDRLNYDAGAIRNIHYGDIHKGLRATFRLADENVPFVNSDFAETIREDALCAAGDIVFADASEDVTDIGKAIEIVDTAGERLVAGLHTILASQVEPTLITGFGAYLFASSGIREQIQQRAQGAKVLGISKSQLADIALAYPKHENEQQMIADCLTSLDDLIRAQGETIEALQAHKTGLMQQLFPLDFG